MKNKYFTEDELIALINDFKQGKSLNELSKKYNKSKYILRKALKSKGIQNKTGARNKYTCNYSFFQNINSEEKAYWLGFIYADGYISNSRKNRKEFKLSVGVSDIDKNHIQKLKNSLNSNHTTIIIPNKTVKLKSGRIINRSAQYRLDIYNQKLVKDLMNKGLTPRKSNTCSLPNYSIIDDNLFRHFVRGYFDGDGSIMKLKDNRIGICIIGSEKFIKELHKKLQFSFNLVKEKRSEGMMYIKKRVTSECLLFLKWIYSDANIYLDRKFNLYSSFLEKEGSQRLPPSHLK